MPQDTFAGTVTILNHPTTLVVQNTPSVIKNQSPQTALILTNTSRATLICTPTQISLKVHQQKATLVTAGFQGPAGPPGPAGAGGSPDPEVHVIPAGQSRVVQSFTLGPGGEKWLVSIFNLASGLVQAFQIAGSFNTVRDEYVYTRYAMLGSRIPHDVQFSHGMGIGRMSITNLSLSEFSVSILKT